MQSNTPVILDDDGDGNIDEDCKVVDAVVAHNNETVTVGNSTSLNYTIYARNFNQNDQLTLYKQQVRFILLLELSSHTTT